MPDIPGVDALWGRSAFHCPYCHGYECTGKTVAVLGAGPERVRLALQLSQFAKEVVLCTAGASLDPQLAGVFERAGIPVRQEPISRLEADGDQIERIVFDSGVPLAREALFIKTELRQSSDLPEQLGCFLLPDAYVLVDEFGHTSVPGVYAAGDMARRKTLPVPVSAVIAAAASGAFAAGVIDQDLLSEDFGLPNPFAMMPAEAEQP
jgi:thioredoxin reductase